MGGIASKKRGNIRESDNGSVKKSERQISGPHSSTSGLREKLRSRKEEISEMDMMVFAFKEAEWKQENKKMREEVKMLRKMVEEKQEKIKGMEEASVVEGEAVGGGGDGGDEKNSGGGKGWGVMVLAEQIREERARRDETVEKWKQLYLAIKVELDDLIQRTHCRNGLYWRAEEEDMVEELKREVKGKEGMIAALKSTIVAMEHEQYRKDREIDILRQSLRIMSCKKTQQVTKIVSRDLFTPCEKC